MRFAITVIFAMFLLGAAASGAAAAEAAPAAGLDSLRFLVGSWTGEANGAPGQGRGITTFEIALAGKALLRRSQTDFPATPARAAFTHEDLLVVYAEPRDGKQRALYLDNEGHVIDYTVGMAPDGRSATFVSDAAANAPRFRLTYVQQSSDEMLVRFEIAPPGKPDAFAVHVEGVVKRRAPR